MSKNACASSAKISSEMTRHSRRTVLQTLATLLLLSRRVSGQTQAYRKPKSLSLNAVTQDWTSFLGPTHNGISAETKLRRELPPPLVWEFEKGSGYASPAIAGEHLIFAHRLKNEEIIECLHPETGSTRWQHRYPTTYEDRFGYNNGPRSSPVVDNERVYTLGAQGKAYCLDLKSGNVVWERDLRADYNLSQDFFGTASTPLVDSGLLIINVGAPGGPCVVGLDAATGREAWRAGVEWGPSYASPVPSIIHGQRRVMIFAGGESNPPVGGLMSINPATGHIDFKFPFRSRTYESANASSPVVFDNKVFITSSYRTGSALVEITSAFTHRVVWTNTDLGLHFNTPIYKNGFLYGFDGRNPGDASLVCVDATDGEIAWRKVPEWREPFQQNGREEMRLMSTYRGSLLAVDGQFLCLGEFGHILWLDLTPQGYKEVSRAWVIGARESWALPVLSRGLLYVVQNTRDVFNGTNPRLLCYDLRA